MATGSRSTALAANWIWNVGRRNRRAPGGSRGSAPGPKTGYQQLYIEHVLQADEGCDFDFLVGKRGSAVPRHSH
jgi:hypothetical protein